MTTDPLFAIRGALEGFYGTFYTPLQRNNLIRFLGKHGFNYYLYGPKNDRYHRRDWREPYPADLMEQFRETVRIAREAGVTFAYALSPGATISYHAADDFALLTAKLGAFYELGVRDFSLFLDDIDPQFSDSRDAVHYANYAVAQADLCNRTLAWLRQRDARCSLSMCPTDYHGVPPFSDYLHELGAQLDPRIDIFYTGPTICSTTITSADAAAFAATVRRPPLLWDNYPVNDLAMQSELHIGPIRGRGSSLQEDVRGVFANLMLQPEASKIPLHTFAAYFRDPAAYDPGSAWEEALHEVAGAPSTEALRLLGENSLRSCLRTPEAERLTTLATAAQDALLAGDEIQQEPLRLLDRYLWQLDEACYHLNYHLANLALRQELVPWTEGLSMQQDMGRHALKVLTMEPAPGPTTSLVRRLKELVQEVKNYPKRIGGDVLLPLAQMALQRVEASHQSDQEEELYSAG